ncbi:MAG: hypothetical protein JWO31_452 [Phycisphaerales bacterium]|nr:hypothetical protein [Phycisphaerales bacterium]
MRSFRRAFLAVALCAGLTPGIGRPVAAAPAKPAAPSPAAKAAVEAAADALRKEFAAFLRDPTANKVRDACDYFAARPAADVTPDAVLAFLDGRPPDADPRAAAYVRWQLLSALPKDADPAWADAGRVARAIEAYRRAPPPLPRFGLSAADQSSLDDLLRGARATDDVLLTSRLEARVRAVAAANRLALAYRDEWYRRLPKAAPAFAAALYDAAERQALAAGAEDFAPLVIADVQTWLTGGADADPARCGALAELLAKLRAKEPPAFYAFAAVRSGRLQWVKRTDPMDVRKKLTHLHQALVEAAQRKPAKGK